MSATSTEAAADYGSFVNKKVIFVRNLPEPVDGKGAVEVEGRVEAWNAGLGLLIKPKGKVNLEMIPASQIEPDSIREITDANIKLVASKLQHVKIGQFRRHILDRHGLNLDQVNPLTEDQAKEWHDKIDHVELKLGHVHVDKKDKDKDDEADTAGDETSGDDA